MKPLSLTTDTFTESVIREMTRICNAAGGINLSQGFPNFECPEVLKEAAVKAVRDGWNQYAITFGQPKLREAIAEKALWYNNIKCDPATEITVTCGATEAMIASLKAIINPGDEIIIFEPFYENYGPDSVLSGANPRFVTLHAPDWHIDFDELSAAFNERTKAIIINTPNNPTGKVFTKQELEKIAELCSAWDCYAVTDEIYEHILYDGAVHVSIGSLPGMEERTITINSLSKSYSVTGWRIGWAIACKRITRRIRKVHDFLTVGAPTPLQEAAVAALRIDTSYYDSLCKKYLDARNFVYDILDKADFGPVMPKGAYYIITYIDRIMREFGAKDDTDFSRKLIERVGVACVPGSSFYSDKSLGYNQVRFCFCKKQSTLDEVRNAFVPLMSKNTVAG